MTLLEERPPATPQNRDVEAAVAALLDASRNGAIGVIPWSSAELSRWVAEQPDAERALGQLVRFAARQAAPSVEPPVAPGPEVPADAPAAVPPTAAGGAAAVVRPVTDPEGVSRSRRRRARICLWIRNAGCLLLVFLAYQWWGTGFEQHRAQAQLGRSFVHPPAQLVSTSVPSGGSDAAPVPPGPPLPGSAVVHLEIPAIALDEYVVEGTGEADLKRGPGHYAGSPLPGQHGNAAIAGHRTTYGAPFGRLDDLKAGDTIVATTATGRSVYVVAGKLTVLPSQTSVLHDYGDDRLTLTTCTPKFSASHRLIVVATLQGPAAAGPTGPAPVATAVAPAEPAGSGSTGAVQVAGGRSGFNASALPTALLSALGLAGLGLLYRPVRRRWPPLAAAAVLTPMWMGGLLMFCESLNRFLPANV
jgi:sortase A